MLAERQTSLSKWRLLAEAVSRNLRVSRSGAARGAHALGQNDERSFATDMLRRRAAAFTAARALTLRMVAVGHHLPQGVRPRAAPLDTTQVARHSFGQ